MSEPLVFGAPTQGPHMVRELPSPPASRAPDSLSASERSHRRRLVREARAAVFIADDPVKRLLIRRDLADDLDNPQHVDTSVTEARESIDRLVSKRRQAAAQTPPAGPVRAPLVPTEEAVPEPEAPPEPARPPAMPPSDNDVAVPSDADVAALARARRTEVAIGNERAAAAAADVAVSDIARLLSRRNGV